MQMRLRSQSKGSDAMRRRCEEEKALWGKANKDRIQVKASATGQGIHILFDRERSLLPYDSDSDLSSSNGSAVSPANSSTKASTKSSTRSSVSLSTRAPTRMRARPPTRASTRASTIASLKAAAKRTPPQTPRANTPYEPTSVLRTPRKLQRHERIGGGTGVTARILDSSIASEGTLLFAGNGPSPLSAIVLSPAAQAVAAATARRARTTRATEAGRGRISTSPDPHRERLQQQLRIRRHELWWPCVHLAHGDEGIAWHTGARRVHGRAGVGEDGVRGGYRREDADHPGDH